MDTPREGMLPMMLDACANVTQMADAVLELTPWVVEMWMTVDIASYQSPTRNTTWQ